MRWLWILLFLSCCGYSIRSPIPPYLKSIAIPIPENRTVRPGLSELLTETLIQDFNRDGRLRIVKPERATLILYTTITNFEKSPQEYDASQNVYLWKITIEAQIDCEDRVKKSTYWKGPISAWIAYDPSKESEDEGIKRAIEKLSEEITRRILTSW